MATAVTAVTADPGFESIGPRGKGPAVLCLQAIPAGAFHRQEWPHVMTNPLLEHDMNLTAGKTDV